MPKHSTIVAGYRERPSWHRPVNIIMPFYPLPYKSYSESHFATDRYHYWLIKLPRTYYTMIERGLCDKGIEK